MSDIIDINPAPAGFGSTHLNPRIESYSDLVFRAKSLLGWPATPIELTDTQWAMIIDEALEIYSQWEGNRTETTLVFCSDLYQPGCGVKLDDLVQVGCNSNYCYQTVTTQSVTSENIECVKLGTYTAYLSVTPFAYPTVYTPLNPYSTAFSGTSGQYVFLYFDPENPWNAAHVCDATCVSISPINSQYYNISGNTALSGIVFDFINDPYLAGLVSTLSAFIGDNPLSAVPLLALGDQLSAISPCFYNLSAFYPDNYYYPPVSACINIGHGTGYIYPNCNTALIDPCSALSAQYGISPTWNYILTSLSVSGNPVLSGSDGRIFDLSARDISDATHLKLYNVPACTTDGSIPLNTNDGILGTFTLCNTALYTNGPMYVANAQFFKDFKPPTEALCQDDCSMCGWVNNGFTMTYYNSAYGNCIRHTPEKVKVNVDFFQKNVTTNVGTISTFLSGNIDPAIGKKRKVLGVFSVDAGNQTGYGGYGGDLLFNFDYALMASTFGYDLQGTRTAVYRNGYDLLTYHMAKSFVEMSRDLLRYVSYNFNPKTQFLKITPEPPFSQMGLTNQVGCGCNGQTGNNFSRNAQCYLAGLYLEPTVQEMLGEYWVREWVVARAMWTLGRIRGAFTGVTVYGGVQLLGEQLIQVGQQRMDQLLKELRQDYFYGPSPGSIFLVG
jgi:hypothetical protein